MVSPFEAHEVRAMPAHRRGRSHRHRTRVIAPVPATFASANRRTGEIAEAPKRWSRPSCSEVPDRVPLHRGGPRCKPNIAFSPHFRPFPTRQEAPGSTAEHVRGVMVRGFPTANFLIGDAAESCCLSRSDEVRAMPAHRRGRSHRTERADHAGACERQGKNQTRCAPSADSPPPAK
jgi:hypothetical protein